MTHWDNISTTFDDASVNKPTIINDATNGGYIELLEGSDNGSNYLRLKAPNSIGSNIVLTFPDNDGDNTNVLQTDGQGNLLMGCNDSGPTGAKRSKR